MTGTRAIPSLGGSGAASTQAGISVFGSAAVTAADCASVLSIGVRVFCDFGS